MKRFSANGQEIKNTVVGPWVLRCVEPPTLQSELAEDSCLAVSASLGVNYAGLCRLLEVRIPLTARLRRRRGNSRLGLAWLALKDLRGNLLDPAQVRVKSSFVQDQFRRATSGVGHERDFDFGVAEHEIANVLRQ